MKVMVIKTDAHLSKDVKKQYDQKLKELLKQALWFLMVGWTCQ